MKPVINKVANELRRKGYIETISRKLGLEERVVEKEFSKEERSYSAAAVKGQANPAARERVCPPAEKELLTLILNSAFIRHLNTSNQCRKRKRKNLILGNS